MSDIFKEIFGTPDTSKQTPIEIALGVDENGMTTAKKLYEFLEMDKSNYSRWVKRNITENEFADEDIDYYSSNVTSEGRGNFAEDFKFTAHFAKKLSVQGKTARAEEAREYFTRLEEKVKEAGINRQQLSPETKALFGLIENIAKQELEQKRQAEKLEQLDNKVDSIKEVVALNPNDWRKDTSKLFSKMALSLGGYEHIKLLREESYRYLAERMGVSLNIRLTNKRRRMADEGICKSKRDKLNQLDVIADDKKLIEGYVAIVKEMAIKYGIEQEESDG